MSRKERLKSSSPARLTLLGSERPDRARGSRPGRGKVADIRAGEGRYVLGASLTLAGLVAAHVVLETARDALFLAKLPPEGLTGVYLLMSLLGFFVGRYDQTVARVLGRTNALILALMVGAMGSTLFFVAELTPTATFLLYLWTGLVGTVLTVQFWLFLAGRFTVAQGRRLYGLIAAGGVLGAVAGGGVSTLVTKFLPVEILLVVSASMQLLAALFLTGAPTASQVVSPTRELPMTQALDTIKQSPYLLRVGALTACATVTILITDYLFKSVTAANVPAQELGSFLARYYTGLNAAALVVQVFIVMRVLQRAGTILALALLPLFLLVGGGATVAFGGALSIVLLTKGADGALRHSLHRVSSELLFLPLSQDERASAKPLFDSVLSRGGQAVGAIVIFALAQFNLASPRILGSLIMGTAAVWVGLALSLRGPYLNQFRRALGRPADDTPIDVNQLNLDGVEVIVEALSSPEENRVVAAMSLFEQAGRTGLIPALVLYHPSPTVLIQALKVIPSPQRKDWVALAARLLTHSEPKVRLAAVLALGRTGHREQLRPEEFDDVELKATACFFHADEMSSPENHPDIQALLHLPPRARSHAQIALVRTIAEFGDRRWSEFLSRVAGEEIRGLDRILPRAMARTRDTRFIPALIARLAYRDGRKEVREALVAHSDDGLDALSRALFDPETSPSILLHIPRAISRFGTRRARNVLVEILSSDLPGAVRFKALKGLGRLSSEGGMRISRRKIMPVLEENVREALRSGLIAARIRSGLASAPRHALASGTLLVSLLLDKQRQSTERTTRLLALLHRNEDLRRVYHALVGDDPTALANAGELLEVLTLGYEEELRDLLRALSDPVPLGERLPLLEELLDVDFDSDVEALRAAMTDDDPPLAALAAEYASRCEIFELASEVLLASERNPWLAAPVDKGPVSVQAPR